MKLYLFDMGSKIYGDCMLAVEGQRRILIDGAHPGDWQASEATASIPEQLANILGEPPFLSWTRLVIPYMLGYVIGSERRSKNDQKI